MKKLRLICALSDQGVLFIVGAMLDDQANRPSSNWQRMLLVARQENDNVIVVTTRIDVNTIIDMFMEDGQVLSSDLQLLKEQSA